MRRHLSEFAVVDDLPNIMLSVAAAAAAEKLNSQLKNIDYSAQLPSGRSLLYHLYFCKEVIIAVHAVIAIH